MQKLEFKVERTFPWLPSQWDLTCPMPSPCKALQAFTVTLGNSFYLPDPSLPPGQRKVLGYMVAMRFCFCNFVHVQPALSFHIAKIKSEFARSMISIYVKGDFPNATRERDFTEVTRGVKWNHHCYTKKWCQRPILCHYITQMPCSP